MTRQDRFKADMEKAGFAVRDYEGRYFYRGYAVKVESHQFEDAVRATKIKLQQDSLGKGIIVYPR